MLRRSPALRATDPFRVLNLPRTSTKSQVKEKYRQLARTYHPDSPTGDTRRMEEINKAYNTLIKEGGYDKMHLSSKAPAASPPRPASPAPPQRGAYASPARPNQTAEKVSQLDAETERVTPEGKFTYQNKESGEWITLDAPLTRPNQPRYNTYQQFKRENDLQADLRKKQAEAQKRENDRHWVSKKFDGFSDSLPSKSPPAILFTLVCYVSACFYGYVRLNAYYAKSDSKKAFYKVVREQRGEDMEEAYPHFKDEMHALATVAAAAYLAAALSKTDADPIRPPSPDPLIARPPATHFALHGGA